MSTDADQVLESIKDPDAWGEAVPARRRKSEKRKRGVVVSVRLSAEEFESLETEATRLGMAMGTYMRQRALAAAPPAGSTASIYVQGAILAGNLNPAWCTSLPVNIDQRPTLTNAG